MFVILLKYTKPMDEVQRHTQAHRDYLDQFYKSGALVVSGRRLDQTGGIILANMASRAEVERFIAEDPFKAAGIAEYEAIDFHPAKYAPDFGVFLRTPPQASDLRPEPGLAGDVLPGPR